MKCFSFYTLMICLTISSISPSYSQHSPLSTTNTNRFSNHQLPTTITYPDSLRKPNSQNNAGTSYPAQQSSYAPVNSKSFENFSTQLFKIMGPSNLHRNMVYSPISLQILLAMVSLGARGNTALEMQRHLHLPAQATDTQWLFKNLLRNLPQTDSTEVIMANKMYYGSNLQIDPNWNAVTKDYFDSQMEQINFKIPTLAAANMNSWVSQKTYNRIQNIISPNALGEDTNALLLNAIYFKGKWATEFSLDDTLPQKFHNMQQGATTVPTMYLEDSFRYGNFPQLNAQIVELPYLNSNLSMWIILPNNIQGLENLEQRMAEVDLNNLSANMKKSEVTLRMPKFQINFEENMRFPLTELGLRDLFSTNAKLDGFFSDRFQVSVSQIQHKAFLNVNEAGSEAAATSFAQFIPLSLPPRSITFTVNHPFMFIIRSPEAVFFIGHVVRL